MKKLTHDAERLALSPEEKAIKFEQTKRTITPSLTQEDVDQIARNISEVKVAYNDLFKADPERANEIMKGVLAK